MEEKRKEGFWMLAAGAVALTAIVGCTAYIAGRTDQAAANSTQMLRVKDCYYGRVREAGQVAATRALICVEVST